MATNTLNRLLFEPAVGGDVDLWGPPLNRDMVLIDQITSTRATISLAAASGVVAITQAQMQNYGIVLTGAPAGSVTLEFFANMQGPFTVFNATTANVSVSTAGVGATGVTVTPSSVSDLYTDGTHVSLTGIPFSSTLATYATVDTTTVLTDTIVVTDILTSDSAHITDLLGDSAHITDLLADTVHLKDYTETAFTFPASSGNITIDVRNGSLAYGTITGDATFVVTGVDATTDYVQNWSMEVGNGGAHDVTWFPNTAWPEGESPTLTTSGIDILSFYTRDGGTTIRGVLAMTNSKVP